SLRTSRPLSITSMLPRVGVCGSQASTATYFVPSVSYAIRGHRSSVISDAAEDDRLMREIVKDCASRPRCRASAPPHGPGRAAPTPKRTSPLRRHLQGQTQRSRWSEGRGPRGMRTGKARTGLRARLACHRRWSVYGKQLPSYTRGGRSYGAGRRRLWHLHRPYELMEAAPWCKSTISAEAWPRLIRSRPWWWSTR